MTRQAVERATVRLHESGVRWARLDAGGSLTLGFDHGDPRRRRDAKVPVTLR